MFEKTLILVFFVMGTYGLYKWSKSTLIEERALVPTQGIIVDVTYQGDDDKDIVIRLNTVPNPFRFLGRFPKYEQVHSFLQVDSIVRVWHKPEEAKLLLICRLDSRDSTIFKYADLVQAYSKDKWLAFCAVVFFYTAFAVSFTRYLLARKRLRANQSLKLTAEAEVESRRPIE